MGHIRSTLMTARFYNQRNDHCVKPRQAIAAGGNLTEQRRISEQSTMRSSHRSDTIRTRILLG
jgi:hypothetical protein